MALVVFPLTSRVAQNLLNKFIDWPRASEEFERKQENKRKNKTNKKQTNKQTKTKAQNQKQKHVCNPFQEKKSLKKK